MKLNYKIIFYFFGLLCLFNGGFMLLSTVISFFYEDGVTAALFSSGALVLVIGGFLMLFTKNHKKELQKRDGYIVVAFGWIVMTLTGTLPYLISGTIPDFTNAFFETISGYTTTGASIINDIEAVPKGILFWRSMTHWIGGMGIIVLAIAILPLLGIGVCNFLLRKHQVLIQINYILELQIPQNGSGSFIFLIQPPKPFYYKSQG